MGESQSKPCKAPRERISIAISTAATVPLIHQGFARGSQLRALFGIPFRRHEGRTTPRMCVCVPNPKSRSVPLWFPSQMRLRQWFPRIKKKPTPSARKPPGMVFSWLQGTAGHEESLGDLLSRGTQNISGQRLPSRWGECVGSWAKSLDLGWKQTHPDNCRWQILWSL